jgi:Zn finger protein HypA/HybF involved in hydrogenase expression
MHDYHAAEALVERLRSEHSEAELKRVTEVRIRASAVYSPEALQQGYEMLTQETPLEASRLLVEEAPCEHRCPSCGRTWRITRDDLADHMILCTSCATLSPIDADACVELLSVHVSEAAAAITTKQEEPA